MDAANEQAMQHQPAQVIVHGRNGSIRTEYIHADGNDPPASPADALPPRV
ncbi:DUF2188 domain-containing protein [Actinacidiphila glaucinigra]